METIVRHVRDLDAAERSAIEKIVGHPLHETERVVIQVLPVDEQSGLLGRLPDWCNVYEGLSEEQIADLEQAVLRRADLSRTSE